MNAPLSMDRREFLKGSGYLTVFFTLPVGGALAQAAAPAPAGPVLPADLRANPKLSTWIKINADKTITLQIGKVELGQGIVTAMAQICADELDVSFDRIKVLAGDTFLAPDEGTTAGSQSMSGCGPAVHQASADVRAILYDLAAAKLNQPVAGMTVTDGVIKAANGQTVAYGDLVTGKELEVAATGKGKPKPAAEYKVIGKNMPRLDIPAKMTGGAIFVQDMKPEGTVYGAVARPPTYQATLKSIDLPAIEKMPGVLKVVRNGSFLGVIATREEQAFAAAAAMEKNAQWDVKSVLPGTEGIYDWLLKAPINRDIEVKRQARAAGSPAPAKTIEATYYRPYHMHGSIGTSAAIAQLGSDGVMTIHTHSQSIVPTAEAVAKMLGMDAKKVRAIHTQGSGCYGHNMADDAAADAALLAQAYPGKPVKLQYTRAQEHAWEPYGSAMVIKTKAGVDKDGNILDWDLQLWSTPHGTRPGSDAGNLLSAKYLEKPFPQPVPANGGPPNYSADRNAIAAYEFGGHNVTTRYITEMPLRVSSTRGLGAYANVFAIESFIDELARAANADPLEFRLRYLKNQRGRDVLAKAAEKFGWDKYQRVANRGRGIAFAQYKNTSAYTAVAIEAEVTLRTGRIRVLKVVAANDSGHMVSPNGVSNQIEGGIVQSLSWTLKEEVKFDQTAVLSRDWASYPIITFSELPNVQVELIDRPGQPYLGTGESAQGPTSAALANAVFDAIGVRLRRVPFTPDRVLDAISKKT